MTRRLLLRVWMPDNPGALGRVASAVGSVGASLVGIEIIEQGGGSAVDELVVDAVNSPNVEEKLVAALTLLPNVSVEEIRDHPSDIIDPRLAVLTSVAHLCAQDSRRNLAVTLVEVLQHDLDMEFAALVPLDSDDDVWAASGRSPTAVWLRMFVEGSRASSQLTGATSDAADTAWTELTHQGVALVVGRRVRPIRERERQQLTAMGAIADRLLSTTTL